MKKKSYGLIVLLMLTCSVSFAQAEISIGIGLPNLSIGINLPLYPQLAPVPGYPVYYAPQVDGNYFFYDGMYWVYQDDNWYASSWYNGPWAFVEPTAVPLYILRIPVRYYRQPPPYFRGWHSNAPPRWGQHWGPQWEQHRRGWDKWNRRTVPKRAPQPTYQKHYTGDRYPHQPEQQYKVYGQKYRYQPRDKAVRQHFEQVKPQMRNQRQQAPPASRENRSQPGAQQHEQLERHERHERHEPKVHEQGQKQSNRGESQEPNRGHGQGQDKDDNRGRGKDK